MTKKVILYACLGLLCCGLGALALDAAKVTPRTAKRNGFTDVRGQSLTTDAEAVAAKAARANSRGLTGNVAPSATPEEAALRAAKAAEAANMLSNQEQLSATATGAPLPTTTSENAVVELSREELNKAIFNRWLATGEKSEAEIPVIESFITESITNDADRNPLDLQGGPDAAGYRFWDNVGGDTATFGWIELCGDPNATNGPVGDDVATAFSWGWNFPFYGTNYTSAFVTTNGRITFVTSSTTLTNACIDAVTPTFPYVAPYWDDLLAATGGGCTNNGVAPWIRYRDFGTYFVMEWSQIAHYNAGSPSADRYSFQIVLFPDGKIKLQYNTGWNDSATPNSATIGIDHMTAGNGLQYRCNTTGPGTQITAGRAIWFWNPPAQVPDFRCDGITSPVGNQAPNATVNVTFNARNVGNTTESCPVKYTFNGGATVSEATAVLAPGTSETHTFATQITLPGVVGDYPLTCWTDLVGDGDRTNDTCRVNVLVRECTDFFLTAPGTIAGNNTGAGDDCAANVGPEQVVAVTIPNDGNWSFSLCSAVTTFDSYIDIATTCCGVPFDSDDDFCTTPALASLIECIPLTAGVYYVAVEGFGSAVGPWELTVVECAPCILPVCVGTPENEADCGLPTDATNGGCNSTPNVFSAITCGETVCGTAAYNGTTRDTDWYQVTTTDTFIFTWAATAEFDFTLWVYDGNAGCPTGTALATISDTACGDAAVTTGCLYPGTYWFVIAPQFTTAIPCGALSEYSATLTCVECTPPPCGDAVLNAPGTTGDLNTCGAGNDCALRTSEDLVIQVNIPNDGNWTFSTCRADTNWDAYMYVTTQCCGGTTIDFDDDTCPEAGIGYPLIECLPLTAGTYWVDLEAFGTACGRIALTVTECVPCVIDPVGGDVLENEVCDPAAGDVTNGGCNSTPPVAQPINCGETYYGSTCANDTIRDTDWFAFTVPVRSTVDVTVIAEQDVDYGIVDTSAGCAGAVLVGGAIGQGDCLPHAVSVPCLEPGITYFVFVAANAFPTPEANYRVTLTCTPQGAGPANDLCANAVNVGTLGGTPLTFNGDNTGACEDCAALSGGQYGDSWYTFTTTETCTLKIDFCGTVGFGNFYIVLVTGCPCDAAFIFYDVFNFTDCVDGSFTCYWYDLPAGTYYYPVLKETGVSEGPYTITFGNCGTVCDALTDLRVYYNGAGVPHSGVRLYWSSPEDMNDTLRVYSTDSTDSDFNADGGADPDWQLIATIHKGDSITNDGLGTTTRSYHDTRSFVRYRKYNVTRTYCVTPPPPPPPCLGDSCELNEIVATNGVPVTVDNSCANQSATWPCGFGTQRDIWISYTATATSTITVSTCASAGTINDTVLQAWTDCPAAGGTSIVCLDDFCVLKTEITFAGTTGVTYKIRLAGYNGSVGTADVLISQ